MTKREREFRAALDAASASDPIVARFITPTMFVQGVIEHELHQLGDVTHVRLAISGAEDHGLWVTVDELPNLIVKLTALYARA